MRKTFYTLLMTMLLIPAVASAKWERCFELTAPYTVFKTSQGRLLASDIDPDGRGDIFYSDDNGDTWTPCETMDYGWTQFIEADGHIFGIAMRKPRVCRSDDGGLTWMILSYENTVKDFLPIDPKSDFGAYAGTWDDATGRLYIPVFGQNVGVIYTPDLGQTWKLTNRQSLLFAPDAFSEEPYTDSYYTANTIGGKVTVGGLYCWYEYDSQTDRWSQVRDDKGNIFNSNCLAGFSQYGGYLYCARAMEAQADPSQNYYPPFILRTKDTRTWEELARPDGEVFNYIRSLWRDNDGLYCTVRELNCWYSPNDGEDWINIAAGYPLCYCPGMTADDKYVYIAAYDPKDSALNDGIYRLPKTQLLTSDRGKQDSIEETAVPALDVTVTDTEISVAYPGPAAITVTATDGRRLLRRNALRADISHLPAGVYIYNVKTPGNSLSAKFVKQ